MSSGCQYPQEPCTCERLHGENSLRNDLAYDVSWGFGIKDRKLLDTVMDRVMETIDAWKQRDVLKLEEKLDKSRDYALERDERD